MTITINTPPATRPAQVSGNPQAFDTAKAEWQTWMQAAVPQFNAQNAENDNKHLIAVAAGESTAYTAAQTMAAAAVALAGANCRGAWSGLTGALNTPASVIHNGQLWVLTANLANVTTATPGVSSAWAPLAQWYALDVADRVPAVQPTLDLDFAKQKYRVYDSATGGLASAALSSILTYTGSGREYVDGKGARVVQGSNVPRLEFDPASAQPLGLSVWSARTNHLLWSDDFTNAAWGKVRANPTPAAWTSQRGQVFQKLVEDSTASTDHYLQQTFASFTSGVAYTLFIEAKAAERAAIELWLPGAIFSDAANRRAAFNLTTGTVIDSVGTGVVPTIKDMGEGIYRCAIAFTATVTAGTNALVRMHDGTSSTYTGNGTSGVYISRAMLSGGLGDAPHIPTTTAAVTAPADVATITSTAFSRWFNVSEGTFVVVARTTAPLGSSLGLWRVDDGTENNRTTLRTQTSGRLDYRVITGGVGQAALEPVVATAENTTFSVACSYKANDFAASQNGAATLTNVSGSPPPSLSTLRVGAGGVGANFLDGTITRLLYFPKALPSLLPVMSAV